jgi:hypothetical protein
MGSSKVRNGPARLGTEIKVGRLRGKPQGTQIGTIVYALQALQHDSRNVPTNGAKCEYILCVAGDLKIHFGSQSLPY